MTTLEQFVSPALTRALGWTLVHSLWQGALVAAVLAGALLLLRRQRAEVRYVASAGALGMVVALAGITFGLYINSPAQKASPQSPGAVRAELVVPNALPQVEVSAPLTEEEMARMGAQIGYDAASIIPGPVAEAAGSSTIYSATQSLIRSLNDYLPLLVVAWLLGLLAMSLRMLGGLLYVQRLRSYRVRPLSAAWQERFAALAARSGVRRPVELLESALVRVPLVVGHWRPVVLLPLGAVAGLTPAYLEAILAHELAHVLRRDYLVNLLQTVAEVLFFYHPAVWFVANCVRTERENCCDDAATALVGGDPLRLARALTALAEWTQSAVVPRAPRLAVAAMGKRGALLNRVRRLVTRRPAAPTLAEGIMAGALVLGGLGLLGGSVALAGPLAQSATLDGKPAAFDWQAGAAAQAAGVADTTRQTTSSATTTTSSAPTAAEMTISQNGATADEDAETEKPGRPRPRRNRERRVIISGRDGMPFPGQPGMVVVTKDKKGRLTDLVVNGQRVETATTGKNKKRKGEQVEIIQMMPSAAPEASAFVYRNDADVQRRLFERGFHENQNLNFQLRNLTSRYPERLSEQQLQRLKVMPNGHLRRIYSLRPDNLLALKSDPGTQRAALRSAERALQDASTAKNLTAGQRKRISQSLEKVRDQIRQLDGTESVSASRPLRFNGDDLGEEQRERQQELKERQRELQERIRESQQELRELEQARLDHYQTNQDREQAIRDQAQARLDRVQADRDRRQADKDRAQAERDRAQADRDRVLADHDRVLAERDRTRNEELLREMRKDGLIKDANHYHIKLTARNLVVDGKEQPQQVFQKYLKLHESSTGHKLNGGDVMEITRDSDSTTSTSGPTPPRPPRAPLAPRMAAPPLPPVAAPAPPAPPRVDSESLRDELRKDGLIGANDKGFQLKLSNAGLTVNGKKQSDDLAAKYRKLTGHADDQSFNVTISTKE
jgi:beta-lactamase regulating signal transducer with metallopeptidase domain